MKYYAVIDTNVLVAALFFKKKDAATVKVVDAILRRQVDSFVSSSDTAGIY